MSVQAMGWVLDHSPSTGTDRLVLISIANHAGPEPLDGEGGPSFEAWPGVGTIQREAGLARERTVQDSLARLVESGAVVRIVNGAPDERVRKDRRSNLYRLRLDNGVTCGVTRCRWCGVTPDASRGDASRQHGVTRGDGTGCRDASPEPSLNREDQPSHEPGAGADAPAALFDQPPAKAKGKKAKPLEGNALIADELARATWEARSIKPVCGFPALRARIGEALDAGHSREAVAAALPGMTVFSRNSFDVALGRPQRGGSRARPVIEDRDKPSGAMAL